MKLKIIIFCALAVLITACVYDFEPDNSDFVNRLVVYSLITNELKPIEVTLSRTVEINSNEAVKETNAQVSVIDDNGKVIQLAEISEGEYSSIEAFPAKFGEQYKLLITTSDGNEYESDFQSLTRPEEIAEVSYEFKEKATADSDNPLWGCQFYVDVSTSANNQTYFRYEMEETWQIFMPLSANAYWNPTEQVFEPVSFSSICWRYDYVDQFFVANTNEYRSGEILQMPLNYVTDETSKLMVKYCLNVKQYAMTESTYVYWKSLADNLGDNSLFAQHPYQVIGNIKSLSNPDEIVLGIFEVSGVSNKRVFVSGFAGANLGMSYCGYREPTWNDIEYGYYAFEQLGRPALAVARECVDCEATGATPVRPDFWE
jgi:hypothetical protein